MPTQSLQFDLACTECGYNLRGLRPSGRCPECGTRIAETFRAIRERKERSEQLALLVKAEMQDCRLPAILLMSAVVVIGFRFLFGGIEPDAISRGLWLFGSLAPGALIATLIADRLGFIAIVSFISLVVFVAASLAVGAAVYVWLRHSADYLTLSRLILLLPLVVSVGMLTRLFRVDFEDLKAFIGLVVVASLACFVTGLLAGIF